MEKITDRLTNSAQTSGDGDLRFFVRTFLDTDGDKMDDDGLDGQIITVKVEGLGTFRFEAPPAT